MTSAKSHPGLPRWIETPVAFIGLVFAAPVIALAAIMLRLDSPGPFLFRQKRVGKNGDQFTLLKLRTMRDNSKGKLVTSSTDDRITRVGRLVRKTKIDELPELWNIVRGEMCIVGPRPEVPQLVDLDDPRWSEILTVNPGLTDPVTLRLRNEEELIASLGDEPDFYQNTLQPFKLNGYVTFLRDRNWKTDVGIIFGTLKAIILPKTVAIPTMEELRFQQTK